MIIAVDFDGTCVTHEYPAVGKERPYAASAMRALVEAGHKLILYTMRSGLELQDAVEWFAERNIPLWGVNCNPEQHRWTSSPKVYANLYIDDAALGAPLSFFDDGSRPAVNWTAVVFDLRLRGVLPKHIALDVGLSPKTVAKA